MFHVYLTWASHIISVLTDFALALIYLVAGVTLVSTISFLYIFALACRYSCCFLYFCLTYQGPLYSNLGYVIYACIPQTCGTVLVPQSIGQRVLFLCLRYSTLGCQSCDWYSMSLRCGHANNGLVCCNVGVRLIAPSCHTVVLRLCTY